MPEKGPHSQREDPLRLHLIQRLVDAVKTPVLAQNRHEMVKARPRWFPAAGQPGRVDENAGFNAEFLGNSPEGGTHLFMGEGFEL